MSKDKIKLTQKIIWSRIILLLELIIFLPFIGMSLPPTIARLNSNNIDYGIWASYAITIFLFFLLFPGIKLIKNKR